MSCLMIVCISVYQLCCQTGPQKMSQNYLFLGTNLPLANQLFQEEKVKKQKSFGFDTYTVLWVSKFCDSHNSILGYSQVAIYAYSEYVSGLELDLETKSFSEDIVLQCEVLGLIPVDICEGFEKTSFFLFLQHVVQLKTNTAHHELILLCLLRFWGDV